jgi:hypothetical protein
MKYSKMIGLIRAVMELSTLHDNFASGLVGDQEALYAYLLDSQRYLRDDDLEGWVTTYSGQGLSSTALTSMQVKSGTLTTCAPLVSSDNPKKRRKMSPNTRVYVPPPSCTECKSEEVIDDQQSGTTVCTMCGLVQNIFLDNGVGNMDPMEAYAGTPYKVHRYSRIVYFRSFMMSMQAETRPQMDPSVLETLRRTIVGDVNQKSVLAALRMMKICNNYRRHALSLIETLTGKPTPDKIKIEHKHFMLLLRHFRRVECVWDHGQKQQTKRKVFLSYAYVFYQLCHHLKLEKYTGKHHLLKSPLLLLKLQTLYEGLAKETGFTVRVV